MPPSTALAFVVSSTFRIPTSSRVAISLLITHLPQPIHGLPLHKVISFWPIWLLTALQRFIDILALFLALLALFLAFSSCTVALSWLPSCPTWSLNGPPHLYPLLTVASYSCVSSCVNANECQCEHRLSRCIATKGLLTFCLALFLVFSACTLTTFISTPPGASPASLPTTT